MRRTTRIRRYGVALVAVGILGPVAACGTGTSDRGDSAYVRSGDRASESSDTAQAAGALLARASESTSAVETGRMHADYRVVGSNAGESIDLAFSADGVFADFGRSTELTLDMSSMIAAMGGGEPGAPDSMVMRQIIVDQMLYMQVETTPPTPGLPAGQWMRTDLSDMTGTSSLDPFSGAVSGGPSGYLESLRAAGANVTEGGQDEIDGVRVTRFDGQIDPETAVANAPPESADEVRRAFRESGMGTIPFTAYVDDDGMVRRLAMTMTMGIGGSSMTMDMVIDLYDFGAPVAVTAPPLDQVVDQDLFGGMLGTA